MLLPEENTVNNCYPVSSFGKNGSLILLMADTYQILWRAVKYQYWKSITVRRFCVALEAQEETGCEFRLLKALVKTYYAEEV